MDMHWGQFVTLLSTIVGACVYLRKEIRDDIRETKNDSKAQAARTDKLYEMYCELRKDNDQKFYDMLKGKK